MNKELTIEIVAEELIDGIDDKLDVTIKGLKKIMEDEGITLEEMREQCWEDSTDVFEKIYN